MSARRPDRITASHVDLVRDLVRDGYETEAWQYIDDLRRRQAALVAEARAQAGYLRAAERALRKATTTQR